MSLFKHQWYISDNLSNFSCFPYLLDFGQWTRPDWEFSARLSHYFIFVKIFWMLSRLSRLFHFCSSSLKTLSIKSPSSFLPFFNCLDWVDFFIFAKVFWKLSRLTRLFHFCLSFLKSIQNNFSNHNSNHMIKNHVTSSKSFFIRIKDTEKILISKPNLFRFEINIRMKICVWMITNYLLKIITKKFVC